MTTPNHDNAIDRRQFIQSGALAAASLTAAAGSIDARPFTSRPKADVLLLIHLAGGLPQFDFWDPKLHTPYRAGMSAAELLSTCPSIPTAAPNIRLGQGLEHLAAVMDRATVIRSIIDPTYETDHTRATHRLLDPLHTAVHRSTILNTSDVSVFHQALAEAPRLIVSHQHQLITIQFPVDSFQGFDAHEYGARRVRQLKKQIDRPLTNLILTLESTGQLDRTLVCITSEFGRTIANPNHDRRNPDLAPQRDDGTAWRIDHLAQYGHHAHFTAANAALLFGASVRHAHVHGKTADQHPLIPTDNPLTPDDLTTTLLHALGVNHKTTPNARIIHNWFA